MNDTDRMLNLLTDEKSRGNKMAVLVSYLRNAMLAEFTSCDAKRALDCKLMDIWHGTRLESK